MAESKVPVLPAYAAAAWALAFAAIHLAWALGWRAGLSPGQAANADASSVFIVYACAVVAACGLAIVVALAMARTRPPQSRRTARLVSVAAWAGTAVLILRAGGSIVPAARSLVGGRSVAWMWPWEPWFWLGASLFLAATWRYHLQRRHADSAG
jgi:hypothetical protein